MSLGQVGQISLGVKLDGSNIQNQINSMASNAQSKMSSAFSGIGKTIAAALSVVAVVKFGKECIDLGSDLQEVQNVVDVTFTSMSNKVNEWATNAANAYGLSETMAKRYVGTFGAMSKSFGFSEQQAYDMSTALTGLSGDVASFYNISQDEAYTKLKSVFTGETESLKDLGVVMTQTALDGYAMANGYNKTTSAMTEQEKVALRYSFVLNQLSGASGDFSRTQDSWANQMRLLTLRFDSLKATLGQAFINVLTPCIKMLNQLIGRLQVAAQYFSDFVTSIFGDAGGSGTSNALTESATALDTSSDNASSNMSDAAASAKEIKKSLAGFDELNVMSDDSPDSSTGTTNSNSTLASASTENALTTVDKLTTDISNKTKKMLENIKVTFEGIKTTVSNIGKSWKEVWDNGTGKKVLENLNSLVSHFIQNVGFIADSFNKAWEKGDLGNSVIQSIIDRANSLIELIDIISKDFGAVWNNGTGEKIWGNILTIIRNCNDNVTTLRNKIKIAWDSNGTGKKIWKDILGIVEDVTGWIKDMSKIKLNWLENLDLKPVMTNVEKLTSAFRELIKSCGDKLKTVYQNVLLPLAKWTIEKAVPTLVKALADALKSISSVVKNISSNTLYAVAGGIAAVTTAIVIFKTGAAIASGIDKVRTAVDLLLKTINSHPILAIASAIGGLILAVQTYNSLTWSNSEAGKFAEEIDGIKNSLETTTSEITSNLKNTMSELDKLYTDNTMIDSYQKKLDELIQKANLSPEEMSQLTTIVTYFSDNVPDFDSTWKKYISISKDGKVSLNGDIDEIKNQIDSLIDNYQELANASAISELKSENVKEQISAKRKLATAQDSVLSKEQQIASEEAKLNEWLKKRKMTRAELEGALAGGASKNDALYKTGAEYLDNINSYNTELDGLKNTYNTTTAEVNKLTMTGDDLSDVMKVLNGDYSDASAVLMAYNEGMINIDDVQKSQWKSLENLKGAAKETGKNTVLGLVEGTEEFKGALVTNSNGLASSVLSEYDRVMDIHSPSKEMFKRGMWTVQGLTNGISDTILAPVNKVKELVSNLLSPFEWLKTSISNVWGGIWQNIKGWINNIIGSIESGINSGISGINKLISSLNSKINTVGQVFGWKDIIPPVSNVALPRLAKGGLVSAPTLALVGDNPNASRDPEVVSPLSKLQGMMSTETDTELLRQILSYLVKLYELFIVKGDKTFYQFVAELDGKILFEQMIKENEIYKNCHNGKSAFT